MRIHADPDPKPCRDEHPGSISESLETIFRVKNSLMRIQDPESFLTWIRDGKISDPGWENFGSGMEKFRIRDGKNLDPG